MYQEYCLPRHVASRYRCIPGFRDHLDLHCLQTLSHPAQNIQYVTMSLTLTPCMKYTMCHHRLQHFHTRHKIYNV